MLASFWILQTPYLATKTTGCKAQTKLQDEAMISFTYIIGANIELAVLAQFIPADTETDTPEDVEICSIKNAGLDIEIDAISISGSRLDSILKECAFDARHQNQRDEI